MRVQSMDYTTLLRVGGELRRRLVPGRVENALQPDDYRYACCGSRVHIHMWACADWAQPPFRKIQMQPSTTPSYVP